MGAALTPDRVPFVPGAVTEIWTIEAVELSTLSASARGAIRILAELFRPDVLPVQIGRFRRMVAIGAAETRTIQVSDIEVAIAELAALELGERAISLYGPTLGGRLRAALPPGVTAEVVDVALDGRIERAVPLLAGDDFEGAPTAWMSLPDAGARFTISIADGEARLELSLDPAWFTTVDPPAPLIVLGAPWSAWQRRGKALLARIETDLTAAGWQLHQRR